jgi:hypothetical protein
LSAHWIGLLNEPNPGQLVGPRYGVGAGVCAEQQASSASSTSISLYALATITLPSLKLLFSIFSETENFTYAVACSPTPARGLDGPAGLSALSAALSAIYNLMPQQASGPRILVHALPLPAADLLKASAACSWQHVVRLVIESPLATPSMTPCPVSCLLRLAGGVGG